MVDERPPVVQALWTAGGGCGMVERDGVAGRGVARGHKPSRTAYAPASVMMSPDRLFPTAYLPHSLLRRP